MANDNVFLDDQEEKFSKNLFYFRGFKLILEKETDIKRQYHKFNTEKTMVEMLPSYSQPSPGSFYLPPTTPSRAFYSTLSLLRSAFLLWLQGKLYLFLTTKFIYLFCHETVPDTLKNFTFYCTNCIVKLFAYVPFLLECSKQAN